LILTSIPCIKIYLNKDFRYERAGLAQDSRYTVKKFISTRIQKDDFIRGFKVSKRLSLTRTSRYEKRGTTMDSRYKRLV
jgi:hypothetical protein